MAGVAYQWGDWRFEPTESRLLRDGVVVSLPGKTLQILATLLRRAPRLVTKEEIMTAVWPDTVVEEGNIAFHIAALRKAIDEGHDTSAIETVRGRGYRFVHEFVIQEMQPTELMQRDAVERAVAAADSAAMPAPAPLPAAPAAAAPAASHSARQAIGMRGRWIALAVIALVVALATIVWRQARPEATTIAVTHFEIVDPPAGQENFPDGLNTYLRTKLQISSVTTADASTADLILSGRLVPKDGGFVVTVQLTRRVDQQRVWDWSFEVPRDADMPSTGQDDARSRLQGVIATLATEGIVRYLSLSGAVPVTR